jgi:hypothetical protein
MPNFISLLRSPDEKERLWAIAKIEEKFYRRGIGDFGIILDELIRLIKFDESIIVRAFALRSLYHDASEIWPYEVEHEKKILDVILFKGKDIGCGVGELDQFIAHELLNIEDPYIAHDIIK